MDKHLRLALRIIAFIPLCLLTVAAIIDWKPTGLQMLTGLMWTSVGVFLGWLVPWVER